MPSWSPYTYTFNNPIRFIDPDGRMPMGPGDPPVRIYTETKGIGHVFISVGEGENTTVFTYGRYAELNKDKSSARSTTPSGEGVMIKLEGQDAVDYISSEVNNYDAQSFEISDADGGQVLDHFNDQMNSSDKVPEVGKYAGDSRAKVVDTYSLLSNNCTTKSCGGANAGGSYGIGKEKVPDPLNPGMSSTGTIISPAGLQKDLNSKSRRSNSNVRNVTGAVRKEYGIDKKIKG